MPGAGWGRWRQPAEVVPLCETNSLFQWGDRTWRKEVKAGERQRTQGNILGKGFHVGPGVRIGVLCGGVRTASGRATGQVRD